MFARFFDAQLRAEPRLCIDQKLLGSVDETDNRMEDLQDLERHLPKRCAWSFDQGPQPEWPTATPQYRDVVYQHRGLQSAPILQFGPDT